MTFNIGRNTNYTDSQGNIKNLASELAKIGTGGSSISLEGIPTGTIEEIILIDEIAPDPISSLMVTDMSKTTVQLKWKKSLSRDLKDYTIYKGSELLGTSTTTTYIVTGLTAGTSYNLTVKARDNSNNESSGVTKTIKTFGTQALSMNGTSGYLMSSILTYDAIEITFEMDAPLAAGYIIDGRNGQPNVYYSKNADGTDNFGSSWSSVYINGTLRRPGASNLLANTKYTIRFETPTPVIETDVHMMVSLTNQSWLKGKIYQCRYYNGSNLVAYYDFTQQFAGTSIPDISGNSENGTISGGAWVTV